MLDFCAECVVILHSNILLCALHPTITADVLMPVLVLILVSRHILRAKSFLALMFLVIVIFQVEVDVDSTPTNHGEALRTKIVSSHTSCSKHILCIINLQLWWLLNGVVALIMEPSSKRALYSKLLHEHSWITGGCSRLPSCFNS